MLGRFIALLALSLCFTSALAQELWQKTRYGMTVEQVVAAVPNASPPPLNAGSLADGAKELLRVSDLELVGYRFSGKFYFIERRLTQVTLTPERISTFASAMLVFDSLTEALRTKYGAEVVRSVERGLLNKAEASWQSGRTNISLICVSVGAADPALNLNYQVRTAKEADKL
jgi:hypothetical protein